MILFVNLRERTYPVFLDENASLVDILRQRFPDRRFALVTNETVARLYAPLIDQWNRELQLVRHVMPDGEEHKNAATWQGILDSLLAARLDRQAVVIALGGGVVGDLAGFAAAAFLRGIDYVQIPTTLLAMVDSSVGGKTGFNHPMGKNLIGAFHQPRMVWIDTAFLKTLPQREYLAGYAEIFKYGFIGGAEMFSFVDSCHEALLNQEQAVLRDAIRRSIDIKAAVVSEDEREGGARALLNFGHTFGHSLEKFFAYQGIMHGEAIWWGMACAIELARRMQLIDNEYLAEYDSIQARLLRPALPAQPDVQALYQAMFSDKKTAGGKIRFVLPATPGSSRVVPDIPADLVRQTLEHIFTTPEPHP